MPQPPHPTLFPYTTLFRSRGSGTKNGAVTRAVPVSYPAVNLLHHGFLAQDVRRDEYQQLRLAVLVHLVAEERPENRDVAEERHLGDIVFILELVDAAQHNRLPVPDQHRRVDLAMVVLRHEAAARIGHQPTDRILEDLELHEHAIVGRDRRRHMEFQRSILELHRRRALATAGAGVLERQVADLLALDDRGFLIVGGDDLGLRNGFAATFLLRRRQFQVEQVVIAQDTEPDAARRHARGARRQVDIQARGDRRGRDAGGVSTCGQRLGQAILPRPNAVIRTGHVISGSASRQHLPARVDLEAGNAQLRAEFTGEAVGRDHEPRFDQHLLDRAVQHRYQLPDFLHLFWGVVDQQGVGALVERYTAARRQEAALGAARSATTTDVAGLRARRQEIRDLRGAAVVDRNVIGNQLRTVELLLARVGNVFLVLGKIGLRD